MMTRRPIAVLQRFVVTSDVTADQRGRATLPISPAIITRGQYQNASGSPRAGARTYDIREWTLMEGNIGITVNFSDGGYRID